MAALGDAVKPYLQEADRSVDPTTGRRLREIWRYFRYSWSIPQVPTPGRQLLYLVRDAAHPAHPVIGIAALNNCPLEMGEPRERYIGWHFSAIVERFSAAADRGKAALEEEVQWLELQLETSLAEIDWTNLVTAEEVEAHHRARGVLALRRRIAAHPRNPPPAGASLHPRPAGCAATPRRRTMNTCARFGSAQRGPRRTGQLVLAGSRQAASIVSRRFCENEEPEPTARPAESALSFHHPQLIAPA